MKKVLNIFIIFIIAIILFNTICINSSLAIDTNKYKPTDITEGDLPKSEAGKIIGAFQAIGSIVSVLALVFIGIKYMMGSTEQKAEYKSTAINYIIGAILVFSISNISAMLYNFAIGLNN